jgi:hypothetical protein
MTSRSIYLLHARVVQQSWRLWCADASVVVAIKSSALLTVFLVCLAFSAACHASDAQSAAGRQPICSSSDLDTPSGIKPRVLISTDIGGSDPDDNQSIVHALLYSDALRIVGFVSTPTGYGGRTSHIYEALDAYAADYPNLRSWSADYPEPKYLKSVVYQGAISKAPPAGWDEPSAGSQAIIKEAHMASAQREILWVLLWGGARDLAQALHDDPSIKASIRAYIVDGWNGQQDPNARRYLLERHRDLWMIRMDNTGRGIYLDADGGTKNSWKMSDAAGHGALGDYFARSMPTLKMGDAPSHLYLLDQAPDSDPTSESWGGRFVKSLQGPNYWIDDSDRSAKIGLHYAGARTILPHQNVIYRELADRFDRARESKKCQ